MTEPAEKKRRIRPQLAIQLPAEMLQQIKNAADDQGQTITQWCSDLFSAALGLTPYQPTLAERITILEERVSEMFNESPTSAP
jgi:hypothetical protein